MTKLKGVAVGAGYFSQFHLDAWARLDDVEITAICDVDLEQAGKAATDFSIPKSYSDFGEMLAKEQPDFVDIITRPDSHRHLTGQAVDAGVAVICQKPLAPTFDEAKELVATAEAAGVRLMIHENFRFQPWYREIKWLLDEGFIGKRLHTINIRTRTGDGWQPDAYLGRQPYFRQMERFLVFEMGVHFVDTMRFLGGEIEGVYASLRRLNAAIAGEDAAMVMFEFANGAEGVWDANRYNETTATDPRYTFGELLVEGEGGSIRLRADGQLSIQPLGKSESEHIYTHSKRNFAGDCVWATQRHFIQCLQNGEPFETSGPNYLRTLAVQEAIYESASSRLPVRSF